jgi:hypothetical protein
VNRGLRTAIAVSVLSAWGYLPSCTPATQPDTYLEREVRELQQRTMPADSHLVRQHSPAIQGWAARADWEFESNYSPDAYFRWVTGRLEPDFRIHETANSPRRFSRYTQGNVETVSIETASASGALHVAIKFELYPD